MVLASAGCGLGANGLPSPGNFAANEDSDQAGPNAPVEGMPSLDDFSQPGGQAGFDKVEIPAGNGTRIAMGAPQVGIQPTNAGVPTGFLKPTVFWIHVANLNGILDSSPYDPEFLPPCQSADDEIPPVFPDGEKPYVFIKTGALSGPPLGVGTDECGRYAFRYTPPLPPNYKATDDVFPCLPQDNFVEIWVGFEKTDPQNPSRKKKYESPVVRYECPQPGLVVQNASLEAVVPRFQTIRNFPVGNYFPGNLEIPADPD